MATNEARKSIREMLAIITLMALDLPHDIDFRDAGRNASLWLTFPTIAQMIAWSLALEMEPGQVTINRDRPRPGTQQAWISGEWHGWALTLWAEESVAPGPEVLDADTIADLTEATGEQA